VPGFQKFRRATTVSLVNVPQRPRPRESRHERGYDSVWVSRSSTFLKRNPFCRFCEQDGLDCVLATSVDHILPKDEFPDLRLVVSNFQPLCDRHHYGTKAKLERIARATGRLLELVQWCADPVLRKTILKAR
jgi:5-methylcytosine-specific restriction endonuclease McrA